MNKEISIIIAGDFSPKERVQKAIDTNNYIDLFPKIKEKVSESDYSIVNFETTIAADTSSHPITKIGSHLRTNSKSLDVLKWLGFKCCTLSNNHFMDYGVEGMTRTISLLRENDLEYVGAGMNLSEARKYLIKNIGDFKIAIINVCEHEFSIAGKDTPGCNPIDIINTTYDIHDAKKSCDYVFIIIHGGIEHFQLPSPKMKKTYRFFIDQGADVIINHHQHCFSGFEEYNGKLIFYGIGNFCFDSILDIKLRHSTYNYGYLVKLTLKKEATVKYELIPYEQCYRTPGVFLLNEKLKQNFFNQISTLNEVIANNQLLDKEYAKLALSRKQSIYGGFRPYVNKIATSLYYRRLLPSFLSKKRLSIIKAIIDCETKNEILSYNLSHDCKRSI